MICFGLCVSPTLIQNEDIWNFHGSLTLNKKTLISDIREVFGMPLYQI